MADQWIQFKLTERPFYDESGNVLQSLKGRKNYKGIDGFSGGGKNYPNYNGVKIKEWYEKGTDLLLLVEDSSVFLEKQGDVLTNEDAKILKEVTFGVFEKDVVSGVTN